MKKKTTSSPKLRTVGVLTKEHIGYVQCINGKTYDIFKHGDQFGFYSQAPDKDRAGTFILYNDIDKLSLAINKGNGSYEIYFFKD